MKTQEAKFYNYREKYIINYKGEKEILQVLVSRKMVFNPEKNELYHEWDKAKKEDQQKFNIGEVNDQYLSGFYELSAEEIKGTLHSLQRENKEHLLRAQRRAKARVFDYVLANPDCTVFCTLTLDAEKINRKDYKEIISKFNSWADNSVRRNGLKYLAVPELHKDGAIHFHLLVNDVLPLSASGTYLPPVGCGGKRKPLRVETLKKRGYNIDECQEVFNVESWKLGFSTAMRTQGERKQVAGYIAKYITKSLEKVGGRYYLHGGKLAEPLCSYDVVEWDDFVDDETFRFEVPGNEYAIIR